MNLSMARSYRWLGGIGYILLLIPFTSIIGLLLVGIAWMMAGREEEQGIFKATGILSITVTILTIILMVSWFPMVGSLLTSMFSGRHPPIPSPRLLQESLLTIGLFLTIAVILTVVGVAGGVLELISHFRAAKVYGVKWFRRAGWMRIITIIAVAVVVGSVIPSIAFFPTILLQPSGILNLIGFYMFGLAVSMILAIVSSIFSAISFFTIPEVASEAG
jgi:uncharacterized membrane protein